MTSMVEKKECKKQRDKYNNHKKWVMFPGRWQPLHQGHMAIIDNTLEEGKNVWIAIRDTEISSENPYTVKQRMEMIKRAYGDMYGDRVKATIIPDIEGIKYGRGVGYFVEEAKVPKEIADISATKIRAGNDRSIHGDVDNYLNLLKSTIWLTGLPCAGKTTLADRLKEEIDNLDRGYRTHRLDGDDVRGKLNKGLGFSSEDRIENLRRVSHLARYVNENGGLVLASFVSPENEMRDLVKNIVGEDTFKLVYVKCSTEECESRDVKGMWKLAREGKIDDFTGVDGKFEDPKNPSIVVDTSKDDLETCVNSILNEFKF